MFRKMQVGVEGMRLLLKMSRLQEGFAELRDSFKAGVERFSSRVRELRQWLRWIPALRGKSAGPKRLAASYAALGWLAVTVAFSVLPSSGGERPPAWLGAGIVRIFQMVDELAATVEKHLKRGGGNPAGTEGRQTLEYPELVLTESDLPHQALQIPQPNLQHSKEGLIKSFLG